MPSHAYREIYDFQFWSRFVSCGFQISIESLQLVRLEIVVPKNICGCCMTAGTYESLYLSVCTSTKLCVLVRASRSWVKKIKLFTFVESKIEFWTRFYVHKYFSRWFSSQTDFASSFLPFTDQQMASKSLYWQPMSFSQFICILTIDNFTREKNISRHDYFIIKSILCISRHWTVICI